jgi:hypothetical protein
MEGLDWEACLRLILVAADDVSLGQNRQLRIGLSCAMISAANGCRSYFPVEELGRFVADSLFPPGLHRLDEAIDMLRYRAAGIS